MANKNKSLKNTGNPSLSRAKGISTAAFDQDWLVILFLFAAVLIAYQPVWNAGFIWDDDQYLTGNPTLQTVHGLKQIWFEAGATVQYYPLAFTSFWVEYHLWGLNPLGYHLINLLLHAASACLLWRLLKKLSLPAPWLAAAIFALHPLQVESVAWITERKNVLSTFLYFAAALAYLQFDPGMIEKKSDAARPTDDPSRDWRWYLVAFILFLGSLFSKTVTCSLPAALLLVSWWKRGSLRARTVISTIPFFATGVGLSFLTGWLERHHVGASGEGWSLTFAERCLIAGRAVWFYAAKLIWPTNLTFMYPRWEISAAVWWQWLFPIGIVAAVAILWFFRKRIGRGPLTATLFFLGTLFPALGFVNVYPMKYSFVADHFQYLAGPGLIVLIAIGISRIKRLNMTLLILPALVLLTWAQAGIYQNSGVLWDDTLKKNPGCWMAEANMGYFLVEHGHVDDGIAHYNKSLAIKSTADAHYNLGAILSRQGHLDAAIDHLQEAVKLEPDYLPAQNNLGVLLVNTGRLDEGISHLEEAIRLNPKFITPYLKLADAFGKKGQNDKAMDFLKKAIELDPNDLEAQKSLAALQSVKESVP